MNKLLKLSEIHYIIVDDSEIKEGDYKWHHIKGVVKATVNGAYTNEFKITHSTQPLSDKPHYAEYGMLTLSEVEEAVEEAVNEISLSEVFKVLDLHTDDAPISYLKRELKKILSSKTEWNIEFDEQGKIKLL